MARNVRLLRCTPDDVFRVLANGWLYPLWVVGTSRMRDVSEQWPAEGATLHHSFGSWPLVVNDTTVMREWDPPRRAVLEPHGGPIGIARVAIDVKARGDACVVRIQEEPVTGPTKLLPDTVFDAITRYRNAETLHRLAYLAEGGAPGTSGGSAAAGFASTAEREPIQR
ncbi:SRPBCC family protein [Microbacterium sp. JC 701]|uniref:SRPBCC family protein n=1 Tax=Microbacterium sp. JC 701 TaxID=2897389 RepID=UPI001E313F0E|nr:SRPBCC family protein [Microbacterium sp. JC 701]MCD2169264.1 SRPBCC family protein [Microbacterium sp. JC 701]